MRYRRFYFMSLGIVLCCLFFPFHSCEKKSNKVASKPFLQDEIRKLRKSNVVPYNENYFKDVTNVHYSLKMRYSANTFHFQDSNYIVPGRFKPLFLSKSKYLLEYYDSNDSLLGSHYIRTPNVRIRRDSLMNHTTDTIDSLGFYVHLPAINNIRFIRLLKDTAIADSISVLPSSFFNIPAMY